MEDLASIKVNAPLARAINDLVNGERAVENRVGNNIREVASGLVIFGGEEDVEGDLGSVLAG